MGFGKIHGKLKDYVKKCDACDIGFASVKEFDSHNMLTHGVNKEYICIICVIPFTSQGALNSHMGQIHKDDHLPPRLTKTYDTFSNRSKTSMQEDNQHTYFDYCQNCEPKVAIRAFGSFLFPYHVFQEHFEIEFKGSVCPFCPEFPNVDRDLTYHILEKHTIPYKSVTPPIMN